MGARIRADARYRAARIEEVDVRVVLRRWLRVLWVCRASLASVLLGLGLAFLTPVHDLFLDVAGIDAPDVFAHPWRDLASPWLSAVALAALVTFFWALPVHAAARLAVSDPAWLGSPYRVPEDRDRPGDIARFERAATWIPRVLGVACYPIAVGAAVAAWFNLPIAYGEPLALRASRAVLCDIGALVLFGLFFALYAVYRRDWINAALPGGSQLAAPAIGLDDEGETLGRWIDEIIAGVVLALLILAFVRPTLLDWFPRVFLVPLLLGVWTPILGFLARFGYRWRLPLGLLAMAGLVGSFYWLGDNHTSDIVRNAATARPLLKPELRANRAEPAPGDARLTLAEAVKLWRAANLCDDKPCPSPIVLLISGGASRSAFFAASALGALSDATCQPGASSSGCDPLFAKRLFAISSVSGGSVGAAVFAKALADGAVAGGKPPCLEGRPSERYFKRDGAGWRACLQKILAEDFLSPVIAGLGFRDVLGFFGALFGDCEWPDRGHRLEAAMSRAYLRFTGAPEKGCAVDRRRGLDATFGSLAPRDLPAGGAAAPWSPILLINSTTSESGKRFVFSGVSPDETKDGPRWLEDGYDFYGAFPGADIVLAAAAHDSARFPVISPAGALDNSEGKPLTRLVDGGYFDNYGASTARDLVEALRGLGLKPYVLLIANDPTVDAHAAFAQPGDDGRPLDLTLAPGTWPIPPLIGAPVDAIVDAATGRGELAIEQLRRLVASPAGQPEAGDPSCLGDLRNPASPCFDIIAVYEPATESDPSAASVKRRLRGISMSWWLSQPVQQYLDNQIELPKAGEPGATAQRAMAGGGFKKNREAMERVCDAIAGARNPACRSYVDALAHDAD